MGTSLSGTAAYRVIRQVLDHVWGPDEDLEDEDLISISKAFKEAGGSWENLMSGDMASIGKLEDAIESHVQTRALISIACRVAGIR